MGLFSLMWFTYISSSTRALLNFDKSGSRLSSELSSKERFIALWAVVLEAQLRVLFSEDVN